jgi:ATP-dependent RNA helicase DeaD
VKELKPFGNIVLSRKVLQGISDMGFEEPSPIQVQTIPLVLEGKDVIGQAQTGTGKTAAFGIPIIERVLEEKRWVQALVLTPTRELANQVAEELAKISKYRRIKTLAVYGGQSIERQIRALHFGVQVVIGTPGRLIDHIKRKTLNLDRVSMVVLDEADEMLDMGFIEDIETILNYVPSERQTLLFSATMPEPILKLTNRYMKNPLTVTVSKEQLTVPLIDQVYYEMRERDKLDYLCRILDLEEFQRSIIFGRTKKGVDELVSSLQMRGYMAEALHGDLSQAQRDRVMKKFRAGTLEILVATDVAARGLDIEHVTHVINYDMPQDPESYVHRIGRTGRAGRKGVAITLIHPREFKQLKLIEKLTKTSIKRGQLPSIADIMERQQDMLRQNLIDLVEEGKLGAYRTLIADLSDEFDAIDLAAAALKLSQEGVVKEKSIAEFTETGAKPGMVRLFMNIGKLHKIRPEDIVRTIAEETDIPGNVIGLIDIYEKFTFVEVPSDVVERVLAVMDKNTIKGRRISVEPAKGRTDKK